LPWQLFNNNALFLLQSFDRRSSADQTSNKLVFLRILGYPLRTGAQTVALNRLILYSPQEDAMIKETIKDAESRMKGALDNLELDFSGIRTGRASPALVERLPIDYYGAPTPLIQLATISVPEPRALLIRPFDPSSLKTIERAILASDLGLNPSNDGKSIRLNLPPLSEERRRDLMKMVHNRMEESRVAIRNIRRDVIKDLKEYEHEKLISEDDLKKAEEELQKLTDQMIQQVEVIGERKGKEVMEV
jgi:ribosome recycling factor